jgi:MoCo/4Fe-4S cofactor protein with predicted Tat translocation signal
MNADGTAEKQRIWRSLEELTESPRIRELLEREFPSEAITPLDELKRRSFLKLIAASFAAAGISGCTRQPIEQIVPYVRQPEEIVPGEPLYFATAMPLSGYGTGILVKSREGRPIKADGNPDHPASGSGSSVWIQACLLDLYNPARAKSVLAAGQPSSFAAFEGWLNERLRQVRDRNGEGFRILTGCVTSPTLGAQIAALHERFPKMRWHQWEPMNWDSALEGARLAFGEMLATHYEIGKANVIASFESDFLYTHPQRLRYTRDFTDRRRVVAGTREMNRLYVVESSPTVTGSMADHRLPLGTARVQASLRFLARELGIQIGGAEPLKEEERKFLSALARDLQANRGASIVVAGEGLPPEMHALEQLINERLGNIGKTVTHCAPAQINPVVHLESLRQLAQDMENGAVDTLLILDGNPVFDAPADFEFRYRLPRVLNKIHLTDLPNETSRLCDWVLPKTHFLESWGDIRSFDGTSTIMQPLIAPLFGGKSEHEVLNSFLELQPARTDYEIVRDYWRSKNVWSDFERSWREAVHDGLVKESALPTKSVRVKDNLSFKAALAAGEALEVTFRPDPHLWDGRFAENAWLHEAPKPLTKLTWDNAALISPALAAREKLANGDLIQIQSGGYSVKVPVFVLPGQAENSITLHFGYGRTPEVGFNAYPLRRADSLWTAADISVKKLGQRYDLVETQTHHLIHGEERQVYRDGTLAGFLKSPDSLTEPNESPRPQETLYNPHDYDYPIKWGMSIDLTTCIGCNACVMACNIENNIPIVGKKQIAVNREMLWLRIDTYFSGDTANPKFNHQPVPCMHCENAPCEYVCPVGATVHDHEGLNLQVYNRCVGTRYCSNNCPYKVRRFNFLRYADYDSELGALRQNPEVTVRWRGVMEKCTYCVQRISAARIRSKEENRPIRDGEVKTACQEACPAGAIVFGIMSDKESQVSRLKEHPLDFLMLGQLNTRPRTSYSAKLRNPNPALES